MTNRPDSSARFAFAMVVMTGVALFAHAQQQTPTQAFTAYRAALATATTYNEVLPFLEAKSRSMIEPMPPATQAKMFELFKRFGSTFTDVAVTRETVNGDTAVLELSGKDPKGQAATGTVPMTREASGWKVGTEKWSSKPGQVARVKIQP